MMPRIAKGTHVVTLYHEGRRLYLEYGNPELASRAYRGFVAWAEGGMGYLLHERFVSEANLQETQIEEMEKSYRR